MITGIRYVYTLASVDSEVRGCQYLVNVVAISSQNGRFLDPLISFRFVYMARVRLLTPHHS